MTLTDSTTGALCLVLEMSFFMSTLPAVWYDIDWNAEVTFELPSVLWISNIVSHVGIIFALLSVWNEELEYCLAFVINKLTLISS